MFPCRPRCYGRSRMRLRFGRPIVLRRPEVANARDILDDPHLKDREFWQSIYEPALGTQLRFPGLFARFSAADPRRFRPAPKVGEHNNEIYVGELGLTPDEMARLREEKVI